MNDAGIRWAVGTTLLLGLVFGAYLVLAAFLVPVAWAGILCLTTWPVHRRVRRGLGGREMAAAFATTSLLVVAVVVPVLLSSWLLAQELKSSLDVMAQLAAGPSAPPPWLENLPLVGPWVAQALEGWRQDPDAIPRLLVRNADRIQEISLTLIGGLGRNLTKVGLTILTAFFFYRHGDEIVFQAGAVARRFMGERAQHRFEVVSQTIRAVLYGLLLTAMAQGLLAAIGYGASGVPAPVLLGALTSLLALIPFGAPLIWLPAALWLLAGGSTLAGLGLLAWGALAVSGIDNVLRPLFISGATRVPYLLVFFGVLGGISAFGLIGLFVGPTLLSVLLALWREWVAEEVLQAPEEPTVEEDPS